MAATKWLFILSEFKDKSLYLTMAKSVENAFLINNSVCERILHSFCLHFMQECKEVSSICELI